MIFNFLQAKDRRELNYSKLHEVAISLLSSADTENTFTGLQQHGPPFFSLFITRRSSDSKKAFGSTYKYPLVSGFEIKTLTCGCVFFFFFFFCLLAVFISLIPRRCQTSVRICCFCSLLILTLLGDGAPAVRPFSSAENYFITPKSSTVYTYLRLECLHFKPACASAQSQKNKVILLTCLHVPDSCGYYAHEEFTLGIYGSLGSANASLASYKIIVCTLLTCKQTHMISVILHRMLGTMLCSGSLK